VFADCELEKDSVIRNFRITAADGKSYNAQHYHLAAIIAVVTKVSFLHKLAVPVASGVRQSHRIEARKWSRAGSKTSCVSDSISKVTRAGRPRCSNTTATADRAGM